MSSIFLYFSPIPTVSFLNGYITKLFHFFTAIPNITLSQSNEIEIPDKGSFTVDCVDNKSSPRPEVSWDTTRLFSNYSISNIPGGQRLTVHEVSVKDWKHFKCFARSYTGRDMKQVNLSILGKYLT